MRIGSEASRGVWFFLLPPPHPLPFCLPDGLSLLHSGIDSICARGCQITPQSSSLLSLSLCLDLAVRVNVHLAGSRLSSDCQHPGSRREREGRGFCYPTLDASRKAQKRLILGPRASSLAQGHQAGARWCPAPPCLPRGLEFCSQRREFPPLLLCLWHLACCPLRRKGVDPGSAGPGLRLGPGRGPLGRVICLPAQAFSGHAAKFRPCHLPCDLLAQVVWPL